MKRRLSLCGPAARGEADYLIISRIFLAKAGDTRPERRSPLFLFVLFWVR